jgi:hypothetical protein
MWTVPVTIWVEKPEMATIRGWPFLIGLLFAALALVLFGFSGRCLRWWRRRNGSFFFVSALVGHDPDGMDRDVSRWRRTIRFEEPGEQSFSDTDIVRGGLTVEAVTKTDDDGVFDTWAAADQLATDFGYAIRRDNAKTPTNLALNVVWPLGIAFGLALTVSSVRIWYVRDPPRQADQSWAEKYDGRWFRRSRWFRGDLIDVIETTRLGASTMEELPSDLSITPALDGVDGRPTRRLGSILDDDRHDGPVAVHVALSEELVGKNRTPNYGSAHAAHGIRTHWTVRPAGDRKQAVSYDPRFFGTDAGACAAVIVCAISTGRPVHVFARVPIPVATAMGIAIRKQLGDLPEGSPARSIIVHNYGGGGFKPWRLWIDKPPSRAVATQPPASEGSNEVVERIINLTAHPVRVLGQDGGELIVFPSEGEARVQQSTVRNGNVEIDELDIPVRAIEYGEPSGLPESEVGVTYIVSRVTAQAAADRSDLVFPDDEVRDSDGQIIGCRSLARLAAGAR